MADRSTQLNCRQLAASAEIPAGGRADVGSACVGAAPTVECCPRCLSMAYRDQVQHLVEATGDGPSSSSAGATAPAWEAEDSLARVAANRASLWRERHKMESDEDFAFCFSS